MNETSHEAGPDTETRFDAHKVRSIADVKRSADDRMVAGVCSGTAKFLNIDPVIVRVLLVALTFVGFAGLILYLATWLLFPVEGEEKSHAAKWFKLGANEEQFRAVALIIAGVFAITAGTGLLGGDWNSPFPWFGLIVLGAVYLWVIRPVQLRRERRRATAATASTEAGDGTVTRVLEPEPAKEPKPPWSPVLTLITLFTSLVAIGGLALYAHAHGSLPWTAYAATALGVIAVGLLIGSVFGNAGALIPIGAIIAICLAIAALLPSPRIGHDVYPEGAAAVASSYKLGIGELDLNLNDLADPTQLAGRTIKVDVGVGQTRIVVPRNIDVSVDAYVRAGEIRVFDRKSSGTATRLDYPAKTQRHLHLRIIQSFGNVEVVKR